MKKLRFKNRNGILYFGIGDKFISSRMKYTQVNKNIIIGKFRQGELDAELGIGLSSSLKVITVKDAAQIVLNAKSEYLKHKTMIAYRKSVNNLILPYLGEKRVSEVKPVDILSFYNDIIESGKSRGYLRTARVVLREIFDNAILAEQATLNPVQMVKMPRFKEHKKIQKAFTLDEIDLILANTTGVMRNFLGISFFTGMRSGELLALKWDDVDFLTETISISKTIADGLINSPKTFSINIDIEMIEKAKEFFKAQQLETGMKSSYVFLNRFGTFHNNNNTFYTAFQTLQKKLGLQKRSLHNTRHTFASIMLNNGIEPMWVSNTLGHESIEITLRVYAKYLPRKEKMSLPFLEKRYKNGTQQL
jgi:integrase